MRKESGDHRFWDCVCRDRKASASMSRVMLDDGNIEVFDIVPLLVNRAAA
jgi:hypothetical protein